LSREEAAQQRGKKLLQAVAGIRPGSEATASWGVIRHQKAREVRRLESMKEMPAPERRRADDDQRYSTNTHARATRGARPAIHDRTVRVCSAWATHANEGLHREDLGGSRPLGAARLLHTGCAGMSANKEAINASGALNRPRRSSGGTTASTASSFSEGSIRR
jgi:hypothetical protein